MTHIRHAIFLLALTAATTLAAQERLIILNEGTWKTNNGRLSYFEDAQVVSNQWFADVNKSTIGDTPNDIIQINDSLLAIAVNWSNIVQFITPEGRAAGATEDVPNNRRLASDGRYLYVTSYGHECGSPTQTYTFTKGFVAKIDVATRRVVDATEVGYEPEGIAYYRGHLFVANTGGYAAQEKHDYETTVSILDAATMKVVRTVDTGHVNLYGPMSQSGRYLLINSSGNYDATGSYAIVMDCDKALAGDEDCTVALPYSAAFNCTATDGRFWAVGSTFSYTSGESDFNYVAIDPERVMATGGAEGVEEALPPTVVSRLKKMYTPYCIYVNPYTGYIYATDAAAYQSAGALYQWQPDGTYVGKYKVYINPGHIVALPPDGKFGAVEEVTAAPAAADDACYNLQGMKIATPRIGQIYIQNGKIHRK